MAARAASMPSGCSRSKTSWAIARSIRVPPNEMQLLAPTCRSRRGKRSAVLDRPCDGCPPCKPGRGLIRTNHAGIIERRCLFRERTALVHDEAVEARPRRGVTRPCRGTFRECLGAPRVVIRWANADCKIWHNDTNAPIGYGWHPVAFAGNWGGAYWKMVRLYHRGVCV